MSGCRSNLNASVFANAAAISGGGKFGSLESCLEKVAKELREDSQFMGRSATLARFRVKLKHSPFDFWNASSSC